MQQTTIDKLHADYKSLHSPKTTTAIKYRFGFKEVNVNLYFDCFDPDSPTFSLILNYEKSYYFTALNIHNNDRTTEYLHEIDGEILKRILENNQLTRFFSCIEEHIQNNDAIAVNYQKDKLFTNTLRYKKTKNLPFLWHLRKSRMTSQTLENLSRTLGVQKSVLRALQRQNFTLVCTNDPNKRTMLTAVLKNGNVVL